MQRPDFPISQLLQCGNLGKQIIWRSVVRRVVGDSRSIRAPTCAVRGGGLGQFPDFPCPRLRGFGKGDCGLECRRNGVLLN
jgi:hypothetical protein